MRRVVFPCLALIALATTPACSGAAPSDLLAGTSNGQTGGVDASFDAGNQHPGGNDAGGVQPDATTIHDSGSVEDVISVPEASVPETGGGGSDIFCGSSTCSSPQQYCCVIGAGQGGTPSYKCQSGQGNCGGASNPGTPVHCDKTADCPSGDVCCGNFYTTGNTGYYSDVTCQASCNGTGPGSMQVQFCDMNANDCPQGMTCQASGALTGYYVCR